MVLSVVGKVGSRDTVYSKTVFRKDSYPICGVPSLSGEGR